MGSSSAPEPDPQIGEAALKSAETGERLLEWMQESSVMPTQWAEEDRARYEEVFLPIQDQFIENALSYDTAERRDAEESKAVASLRQTQAISDATRQRQAAAMGVDPQSGRYQSMERAASLDNSLAEVGVRNAARTNVENTGMALMGDAINMGSGLAVNPGTSLSIASGMNEAGFSGAIQGYQTQGNLLNQQYQNQLAGWQASQNAQAGMLGGLGGLLGAGANLAANGASRRSCRARRPRPTARSTMVPWGLSSRCPSRSGATRKAPAWTTPSMSAPMLRTSRRPRGWAMARPSMS